MSDGAGSPPTGDAGLISGTTTSMILRCAERAAGADAPARMVELAGWTGGIDPLRDDSEWIPYWSAVALFRAGIEVTGDPDFPVTVGQEVLRQYEGTEVAALFRSLGSPGEVLRNVAASTAKFATGTDMRPLEVGEDRATIEAWAISGSVRDPTFCAYAAGVMTLAPVLFGMEPADVTETRCQSRGDPRCVYEVHWDPATADDPDPSRRIAYLEGQLAAITERFEALQATTAELIASEGVDPVLETITRRAAVAVRASQYVLVVRIGTGPMRLRHAGFDDDDEARATADDILAEHPDDHGGSRLVVDIATPERHFGRLAAIYPDGLQFFQGERRLLEAYAATAATALAAATSHDEARRQHAATSALLRLAAALAQVNTSDDVAERLAEVLLDAVGAAHAAVLLRDEGETALRFAAVRGLPAAAAGRLRAARVTGDNVPGLAALLEAPEPQVIDGSEEPYLRKLLELAGTTSVFLVPIAARGVVYGALTVSLDAPGHPAGEFEDLLRGMANHAATALENARLLEHARHQALHDSLTGLANRSLLEARAEDALGSTPASTGRVALLYLDVDDFKGVNDRLGHAAGDELLVAIAARLRGTVRAGDTVARVGGDEFVVLLEGVDTADTADRVANGLLAKLRLPIDLERGPVQISASIGVAVTASGVDYDELLKRADTALYAAKAAGRDQVVTHGR